MDDRAKKLLAVVENYGKMYGNYAHLTPIVLRDLQMHKRMFLDKDLSDVIRDPNLYDQAISAFWDRLDDFGIKDNMSKVLWWRAPGEFMRSGGNINNIRDDNLRNIMMNRVKNIRDFFKRLRASAYTNALSGR